MSNQIFTPIDANELIAFQAGQIMRLQIQLAAALAQRDQLAQQLANARKLDDVRQDGK